MASTFNQFFHARWSQARCRDVYRALIFSWHPDRNKAADATRVTQEINTQYATAKRLNPKQASAADDALRSQVEEAGSIYRDAGHTSANTNANGQPKQERWQEEYRRERQANARDARHRARQARWQEGWEERHAGEPESWRYRQNKMF